MRSSRGEELRVYALTCGWLSCDMAMMLEGVAGQVRFPVPAYLIEHPKGRVLFDAGLHPDAEADPFGRIGALAKSFKVEIAPQETIQAQLQAVEVDPEGIDVLISSHLHFDHAGGIEQIPNATIVIQQREWEAGHRPEMIEANGFNPHDYDLGHRIQQVVGAHDLFGDGSIVTLPTYGHTPGHQSLQLAMDSGPLVLSADACYFKRSLDELHLPALVNDREEMLASLRLLQKLRSAGATIFFGHDPEFWESLPKAPRAIL